jgi:REP element-mobilizing transposase RayT
MNHGHPRRHSIRLKGYDYSKAGAYFVTICTQNRECLLGEIVDGKMILNDVGEFVKKCWNDIPLHFPHVKLDIYCIMPNHIHGIINISDSAGAKEFSPLLQPDKNKPIGTSKTIGSIVRGFKIGVAKFISNVSNSKRFKTEIFMSQENKKINVKGTKVTVSTQQKTDYICITDIAKFKNNNRTDDLIRNWLRNRNTIEFLGIWEQLNNPDFKPVEFDGFKKQAGLNSFTLTPKQWISKTGAIGLISKQGRYGGTYAHKDIAFEFASWISVEFKLYLIKEFQRLKEDEQKQLGWDIRRNLTKINYRIHTDAIKENLIPRELTKRQVNLVFASEADILNMALFGKTAKQWRDENPGEKGNIRDFANVSQLVCLSNLENLNAHFIGQNLP